MAEQTTVVVSKEHMALAATLYDGVAELAAERAEPDFVDGVAEQVACFHTEQGRLPRCHQELDAWSNDVDEFTAYMANNPVQDVTPALDATPAAEQQAAADAAEKQAKSTLTAFGKACKAAGDAALLQGRLATEYIDLRLASNPGATRSACTGTLVSTWQEYSDSVVNAQSLNAMIRLYQTAQHFTVPKGQKRPPLRVYRAFSVLVQRDESVRQEKWAVIPGMDGAVTGDPAKDAMSAHAEWAKYLAKPVPSSEVESGVTLLQQRYNAAELTARRLAAEQTLAAATAARKQREQAEQQQAAAENAAKLAEQAAAAPAAADVKAVLTAAAAKAQQDAAAAAAAKDAARLKQEQADRDAGKADADRREQERLSKLADDKQAKQQAKDDKANGKTPAAPQRATDAGPTGPAPKPPQAPADGGQNLLAAASKGTAKDVASMVAGLVQKCGTPDDCLLESLRLLAHSAELSAKGKAACVAAIAVLTAAKTPAASNGHIAASNGTVVLTPAAPPANGTVAAA